MHIMEGFLPAGHAAAWTVASAPFWGYGVYRLAKTFRKQPEKKLLVGAAGGFTMLLSSLKLPSVSGSCSHPTGMGLGAILFGPGVMFVLGTIVLVFQALLLAHGGITTLGANAFSMAVVGGLVAFGVYRLLRGLGCSSGLTVFFAAALSDMCTYVTTGFQLALAFPDPNGGFWGSFAKFNGIFAFTQIPLALSEGLLTVFIFNTLLSAGREETAGGAPQAATEGAQ